LFYRIRQTPEIRVDELFDELSNIGVERTHNYGWCHKATFQGKNIDFFFPEEKAGPNKSVNMRAEGSDEYNRLLS